jgi:hypothetical protein
MKTRSYCRMYPATGKVIALWVSILVTTLSSSAEDKACGPPHYCARTDRRTEPYPKTAPAIGPAGSIITDPTFGSRIVRVTDAKTRTGETFSTPSSATQNPWNSAGTSFFLLTRNLEIILYDFNPSNMTPHERGVVRMPSGGEPEFSSTEPNFLFATDLRSNAFAEYDISTGRFTELHSISKCAKLKASDRIHGVSVSGDDTRMSTSVGPQQDLNYLVYVYDRKQGCRWYNTQTGEVGGEWGPRGTVATPERYFLHGVGISKSGKYVSISRTHDSPGHRWLIWDVETMNVTLCPAMCSGHHVMGYSHLIGPSGNNHPMDTLIRPLDHLEQYSALIPDLQKAKTSGYWYDSHFSWNNVDPSDSTPFCFSTYRPSNPQTQGTPPDVDGPWENEIDCMATDHTEKIFRFAHTYSTAKNGFWSSPRGNVSRDGRFYMFTSDWEDQLGKADKGGYRTDVFIVELR